MAEKYTKSIDIATDLAGGDNDFLMFSTNSPLVGAVITISGLTGVLGAIDLTEANDKDTSFPISGAQIAVPANGTEKVQTVTGCSLVIAGIRIAKGTATAGTIVIESGSK